MAAGLGLTMLQPPAVYRFTARAALPDGGRLIAHPGSSLWAFSPSGAPEAVFHPPQFTDPANPAAYPARPGGVSIVDSRTSPVLEADIAPAQGAADPEGG